MNGYEAKNFAKRFTREPSEVLCFWQGQSFKKSSPEFKKLIKQILEAKSKTYDGKIFKFAGYDISSVNSFILALKSDNPEFQKQLMLVSEDKVKEISKNIKPRYCPRTLYWNGKTFTRDSEEYKKLLEEVYKTRYKHDYSFRQALRFAKKYTLEHSIGKNDIGDTVLTKNEFINILKNLQKNDKLKYKCFDYFKQILKCIFR